MPADVDGALDRLDLPPLIDHRRFNTLGEWIDSLYAQYLAIVREADIRLWGKPLIRRSDEGIDGRDVRFWHIITESAARSAPGPHHRKLSLGRAAIIGQAWHLLELLAAGDIRAVWWREEWYPGTQRVFVTTVDFNLVVVLQEARGHFSLITLYPVGRKKRAKVFGRVAAAWESGACGRDDRKHPKWRSWTGGQRPPARQIVALGGRT